MNQTTGTVDPGLVAVDLLYKQMMIDEAWSVRTDRGFIWWAYRLAQHVEASEPFIAPDGATACQVRIWTDIGADVTDAAKVPAIMAIANMSETMNAVVWDGTEHTISECCTSTVYADTVDSWLKVLSTAAVLQNCAAHSRAHGIVEALDARIAESNHPVSGQRPAMDDVLNVPAQLIAPEGTGASKFAGRYMEQIAASDSPIATYFALSNGNADGFTGEIPYSGNRSVAELAATDVHVPAETALLQVITDQPHPQLGSGALITLKLPVTIPEDSKESAAETANALNFLEAASKDTIQFANGGSDRTTLLGAWCVDPTNGRGDSLAFVSFIPSILARAGLLENLCIYNAVRTSWAHRVMND
jgi:hypothetical protein